MMNVKDGRKRSVFYRYIVFGLLVIMVPCFLLIGVWTRERYVEQERQLMDEENLLLIQMMENVENGVDDLREISQQIMLDKEISPYLLRKGNYYTVEALNKLELYCKGTNIFEDLMICLNAEQEIYRTDGKETSYLKTEEQLTSVSGRKNLITYPLLSYSGECYGTLIGVVPVNYFESVLQASELESDTVICNGAEQILFTTKEELNFEGIKIFENYDSNQHFYEYKLNQEKYQAVVYRSDVTGWYYWRIVSQDTLYARTRQEVMPFAVMLLLLCVFLSVVIGVLIAFYRYLPVQSLLRLFNPNISYSAKRDELSLINHYIIDLQKENITMKLQIKDREMQKIREVFTEVLYGGGTAWEADRELLEQNGFCEQVCEFCVVLLTLQEAGVEADLEYQLKALAPEELFFITREIGDGYVCLYYAPRGTRLAAERITALLKRLKEEGYSLRASTGALYR